MHSIVGEIARSMCCFEKASILVPLEELNISDWEEYFGKLLAGVNSLADGNALVIELALLNFYYESECGLALDVEPNADFNWKATEKLFVPATIGDRGTVRAFVAQNSFSSSHRSHFLSIVTLHYKLSTKVRQYGRCYNTSMSLKSVQVSHRYTNSVCMNTSRSTQSFTHKFSPSFDENETRFRFDGVA